jgi:diguanylate cyclase (GGDEF)-like protein/PAS domain S-box-containing protein
MPGHSAARARLSVVATPPQNCVAPSQEQEAVPPLPTAAPDATGTDPEHLQAALLTWAEADDGAIVLLDASPTGPPTVRWANAAAARLLGYAEQEMVGEHLDRLLRSPFAAPARRAEQEPFVDGRRVVRRALSVQRRDGAPLQVHLTSVPVGQTRATSWVVRLVQEPDAARVTEELRTSHERFRALADRAPIAIFCSEAGLRLAYVNDRASELFGTSPERLEGMGWLSHIALEDRPTVMWAMAGALEGSPQELPLKVVRSDGRVRSVHARLVPVRHARRDAGFVGTLEDVTDRQAFEASLAHQASRDALTGLLNRRQLLELLSEDLEASSAGGGEPPALLFLDLDDFKQVNDALGHQAGDQLLIEVSRRLREAVREGDVVSRFGGDEFAVLCRGLHDEQAAGEVARRVLEAVTGPVVLAAGSVTVSGSLGVVVAGPAHAEGEDVLRDADIAMYQAKAAGKDRWALFDELARTRARDRVELAQDLRVAVEQDGLEVHYQPLVRLTGRPDERPVLASVEALARWTSERHGSVPPGEFVALAEETGLVPQLGLQVLRRACRQMVTWQAELGAAAPRSVSVNVSALQLRSCDFAAVVAEVLAETGLPGSLLCLELTETVVMHDETAVQACFWRLHELGVKIAIDDFGTGYSSLSVLRRLPFDQLKIDRSVVPDFTTDAYDPVVAAVVGLGHALGLTVVAEGVETQEQAAGLRALGCPLAQGFLYGRPMPPRALEQWARAHVERRGS